MKRVVSAPAAQAGASFFDPDFSRSVIEWQRTHGRHALPWQQTRDAYRIWLSEIMLQQTQVAAVIPYYQRFLQRFPDVRTLAAAPVEAVMESWSGLGYYSRARNLHRCAQQVVVEHGGDFPRDPAVLATLPGIGRSTAAAIAAFAYGARAAILDGNVKRVFCRAFGVNGFPGVKAVENILWQRAEALLPGPEEGAIEAYTQGLMDLGATVCTRARPACEACPLSERCVARAEGRTRELPAARPAKTVARRACIMLVVQSGSATLLEQRPVTGIWGGLLSLPESEDMDGALARAAQFGEVESVESLPPFTHVFTHFRLDVAPLRVILRRRTPRAGEGSEVWLESGLVSGAALPAPVKKLLLGLHRSSA